MEGLSAVDHWLSLHPGTTATRDRSLAQTQGKAGRLARTSAAIGAGTHPPSTPLPRVVVVDTAEGAGVEAGGSSDHGHGVTAILAQLLCPETGAECIEHAAALHQQPEVGRQTGTRTDLATAIFQATRTRSGPTILNLSLGWAPEHALRSTDGTAAYRQMNPHDKVALASLVWARCHGALPIAAAGNRPEQSQATPGPLWPAGWMDLRFQGHDHTSPCAAFDMPESDWKTGHPVVYGISGAARLGYRSPLGRDGAIAPLAAHAVGVAAPDPGDDSSLQVVSGTSASTAVASAAAAIAWSAMPDRPGDDALEAVFRAGTRLEEPGANAPARADFGGTVWSPHNEVRAVHICHTAAMVQVDIGCPAEPTTAH